MPIARHPKAQNEDRHALRSMVLTYHLEMASSLTRLRVIPLVVAFPLFLQNLDSLVLTTALPTIANALNVGVLDLNLAITAYLLSLAVFLPASAWLVQRMGAKRVFCVAVLMFTLGSALCGMAQTLGQLIVFRLLQGIGGSVMVPVGRTIMLRSVPSADMVRAMVWFTIPGALGRLAGPLFGGVIVTLTSWRWIFLVNIPFGLIAIALALWLVDKDPDTSAQPPRPFDLRGLVLLALGLAGILGGLELSGKGVLPGAVVAALVAGGFAALYAYVRHSRRAAHPIIDLAVLRTRVFRTVFVGGFPLRVTIGAAPFLLPLMLQIGFGFSPMASGFLTMAMAIGALSARLVLARTISAMGFRKLLITMSVLAGAFYAMYGMFTPNTPTQVMFGALLVGGLCTSIAMVSLNTLGYGGMTPEHTGHAAALSAMGQQVSTAAGVVLGASVLAFTSYVHNGPGKPLVAADFPPAFAVLAVLALMSAFSLRRLRPEDGEELRARASQ